MLEWRRSRSPQLPGYYTATFENQIVFTIQHQLVSPGWKLWDVGADEATFHRTLTEAKLEALRLHEVALTPLVLPEVSVANKQWAKDRLDLITSDLYRQFPYLLEGLSYD